ncbi:MAG: hypothetical protein ACYC5A_08105 [Thermoleophilia bacterium]
MKQIEDSRQQDTLLSFTESYLGDETVEIFRTAKGRFRVIHSLFGEDHYSGDWERQNHESICDDGTQVYNFLLETMDTLFGDAPWYITEALDAAEKKDTSFNY